MVWEEKYLFLDEFYGGIGLFFMGLASQKKPGQELEPQKKSKDELPKNPKHSRFIESTENQHIRQRKPSNLKSDADDLTDAGIVFTASSTTLQTLSSWKALSSRCTNFLSVFSRTKRKQLSPEPSSWLSWYYEHEHMVPEPEGAAQNPQVLGKREEVSPSELEDYISIEPRMRCHKHADSLFSTSSGFTNYRGILNWLIVISLCSMGRTALENVIKYGILVSPFEFLNPFIENPHEWRCLRLILLTNVYVVVVFFLERLLSRGRISEGVGLVLNSLTLASIILVPGVIVFFTHPNPFFSSITLSLQTVTFLKLVSYVQVNKWCRDQASTKLSKRKRLQSSGDLVKFENGHADTHRGLSRELVSYPHNLTFKDLYYFLCIPTLCYELNFPRSERIRKRFLTKRILEMLFLVGLMVGLVQQWIVPIVHNSRIPFKELDLGKMLERLLKLSIPNHFIWLLFFYWMFHSCLNTIAEIMRFGDRVFYRDWWNASNIREFWKNWNIPVHRWATRHLYKPMVTSGYSSGVASISVFLVSAFFHEYLLSVPLNMFRLWAFMAMLGQVPLAYLTRYVDQKTGNIVVWLSLIIGQPAAVLMYYHDYYITRTMDAA